MGFDIHGTRFLLYAKRLGVDYSRTLMIGRQGLHLRPADLRANLARLGFEHGEATVEKIFDAADGYAEELLRFLGADEVHSLDNSDYEGATHQQDLNLEVADSLRGRYSVVVDGGSLEHVFNYPRALASCMEMVAVDGHLLAITPANNFMGHGFYQFSPELFLSVFRDANGFRLRRLIAFEDRRRAPWYRIARPDKPTKRIMSLHSRPVYLLVLAQRTAAVPPLRRMPQQSDYLAVWRSDGEIAPGGPSAPPRRGAAVSAALRLIPGPVKRLAKVALGRDRRRRRFDPRYFRKLDWAAEAARLRREPVARPTLGSGSELGDRE